MTLNAKAGGSKSGFLKQVATWKRDRRVRELVDLGISVADVAQQYEISKTRVYQLVKRTRTVLEDPDYFWSWVLHADRVKTQFPDTWREFCGHWKDRSTPDKPDWVLAYEAVGR